MKQPPGPAIPDRLVLHARRYGQSDWIERLPNLIRELAERWQLELGEPFAGRPGISWVAPAGEVDGLPVVLKVGMPHREGRTEAAGLEFFGGRGAVKLVRHDLEAFALLEERCLPGEDLWTLGPEHGNTVAAAVLSQLWRPAEGSGPTELLSEVAEEWTSLFAQGSDLYPAELLRQASLLARELAASQSRLVVLHGDFHPGNVLRSTRGWLSIDCKPLIGEPAFDPVQLLANRLGGHPTEPSRKPGSKDPIFRPQIPIGELSSQIEYFARALDLDGDRVLGWALVKSVAWNWGATTAQFFADTMEFRRR